MRRHESSTAFELRALVALSWPIAIAHLALIAMALVETAILGRVSTVELAGAAIGRSLGFGAITVAMGVAQGLEPLAAQAIGAGEPDRAWGGFLTTTRAVLLLWGPLMAVSFASTWVLAPLGVDAAVVTRCRDYQLGQAPGLALSLVFLSGKTFLQSHGKTRPAVVAALVANLVNLAVCNLLVRGDDVLLALHLPRLGLPRLGALGAGIAYTVAGVVLAAIVLPAAWSYRPSRAARKTATSVQVAPVQVAPVQVAPVHFAPASLSAPVQVAPVHFAPASLSAPVQVPPADLAPASLSAPRLPLAVVLRLGLPVGLQMLAEMGVFTVATLLVGKFGSEAVSAHQIALGMSSFTYMGALGVSGATAVRVGHAVGQGRSPRKAGILGIAVGAAFMSVGALLFAFAPRPLMHAFTTDVEVVTLGVDLLFIAALFQLFDGVQAVAGGALRGAGDVRYSFLANFACHWAIGFPLACVLGLVLGWGVRGIWWGLTAGLVAVAAILTVRFVRLSSRAIVRV